MAFNGSGVFNRIYNWVTDAANNVPITASRMDTEETGFATGLSNCITKDGQQVLIADIPWAGFKITGLGDAVSAQDAVNLRTAQTLIQSGVYGVDSGAANAMVVSVSSFAYTTGAVITLKVAATNTSTTVNLNVNSLGNKLVLDSVGVAISIGALVTNQVLTFIYDGTSFRMISPIQSSGTFTCTWSGFSAPPASTTIAYSRSGQCVTLRFPVQTGTSNNNSFGLTGIPTSLRPATAQYTMVPGLTNNGAALGAPSGANVNTSGGIDFMLTTSNSTVLSWATSNSKGMDTTVILTYALN